MAALLGGYKFSKSRFASVQSASVSYMITIEVQVPFLPTEQARAL